MIALLMMQAAMISIPSCENSGCIRIGMPEAYLQMVIVPNNPKAGTVLLCQQVVEPGGTYPKAPDDFSLLSCHVRKPVNSDGR